MPLIRGDTSGKGRKGRAGSGLASTLLEIRKQAARWRRSRSKAYDIGVPESGTDAGEPVVAATSTLSWYAATQGTLLLVLACDLVTLLIVTSGLASVAWSAAAAAGLGVSSLPGSEAASAASLAMREWAMPIANAGAGSGLYPLGWADPMGAVISLLCLWGGMKAFRHAATIGIAASRTH